MQTESSHSKPSSYLTGTKAFFVEANARYMYEKYQLHKANSYDGRQKCNMWLESLINLFICGRV